MDTQTVINLICLAFGVGGGLSSLVIKASIAAEIQKSRREDREKVQEWVERNFLRKPV
jgi:hypothetical protein